MIREKTEFFDFFRIAIGLRGMTEGWRKTNAAGGKRVTCGKSGWEKAFSRQREIAASNTEV